MNNFLKTDNNHKSGQVTIIGPPNSGKSTLLNSLLGQKLSIVTPKPQTTRNRISGILHRDDAQIIFLDTPGIHQTTQTLNSFFIETAWQTLTESDLIVLLLDTLKYKGKIDLLEKDVYPFLGPIQKQSLPLIIGLNKIDRLADKKALLPGIQKIHNLFSQAEVFPVSALTGENTQKLLEQIIKLLPTCPPLFSEDQLSLLPMRFFASEIIREKLFFVLEQELPYNLAVQVDHWQEIPEKNLVHISAVVYVARKSHKSIVIGKKGTRLKDIGQKARMELEEMMDQKVYLQLWVKVKPKWTEDRNFISQLQPESC